MFIAEVHVLFRFQYALIMYIDFVLGFLGKRKCIVRKQSENGKSTSNKQCIYKFEYLQYMRAFAASSPSCLRTSTYHFNSASYLLASLMLSLMLGLFQMHTNIWLIIFI